MKKSIRAKTVVILAVMLVLAACAGTENKHKVTVNTGALDNYYSQRQTTITQQNQPLNYKTNGQCQRDQAQKECMWWGINFQYPALQKNVLVHCTSNKIINSEPNNPRSLFTPSKISYQWDMELTTDTTSKTLPFSSIAGKGEEKLESQCTAEGFEDFSFTMLILLE